MSSRRYRKGISRKRIALGGTVAAVVVGALVVTQNSFAASIPGFGRFSGSDSAASSSNGLSSGGLSSGGLSSGGLSLGGRSFPSFGSRTAVDSTGDSAGNCPDAHIIVTRASTEAPGTGVIGSLANAVTRASDQEITVEATDYPAALNPYAPSVAAGTEALTEQLTDEATNCPDTKIVMMGYSQGAHVIGDVLAGTGRAAGFTQSAPIDPAISGNVVAVVLMGDPRHVPGESFNAGTARTPGLFARGDDASLDAFADRTQSYCDTGDTFCAGGASIAVHLGYTRKYNGDAEEFILSKIGG